MRFFLVSLTATLSSFLGACVFTLVCLFNENKLLCTNCFAGSNGHEFVFLLKGHEDLRQDERVMQLFGLVNTLLANDPTSLRKNLRCVLWVITESACDSSHRCSFASKPWHK